MADLNCISLAGDGKVAASDATWNTVHDATTGTAADSDTSEYCIAGDNSGTYVIHRMFMPIDTSTLPAGASISAASLFIKSGPTVSGSGITIGLVQTDQASTATLADADFNNCGAVDSPTEGATRVNVTTADTWYELVLNATGISWIVNDEVNATKLGIRGSNDLDDTAPAAYYYANFHMLENATEANRPYLAITYTIGGATNTSNFFSVL